MQSHCLSANTVPAAATGVAHMSALPECDIKCFALTGCPLDSLNILHYQLNLSLLPCLHAHKHAHGNPRRARIIKHPHRLTGRPSNQHTWSPKPVLACILLETLHPLPCQRTHDAGSLLAMLRACTAPKRQEKGPSSKLTAWFILMFSSWLSGMPSQPVKWRPSDSLARSS